MLAKLLILLTLSLPVKAQLNSDDRLTDTNRLFLTDRVSDNHVEHKASTSLAADYVLTWPLDDGALNECLKTDGSGVLSWGTCLASAGGITIGDAVSGGTLNAHLQVDGAGNIANSLLTSSAGNFDFGNTGNGVLEACNDDTGDRSCQLDLNASDGLDYSFRVIRALGVNGQMSLLNTGTGDFNITQENAGNLVFRTSGTVRGRFTSTGAMTIENNPNITTPGTGSAHGLAIDENQEITELGGVSGSPRNSVKYRVMNFKLSALCALTYDPGNAVASVTGTNTSSTCTINLNDTFSGVGPQCFTVEESGGPPGAYCNGGAPSTTSAIVRCTANVQVQVFCIGVF